MQKACVLPALYAWSSETENLYLHAGRFAGVLHSHGYTLAWKGLLMQLL